MPRGEMLKTKIKREILATIPVAVAVEEAKRKVEARKPLKDKLEESALKFVDRISIEGAAKIALWVGLAYLIKPTIDLSEEVQQKLATWKAITTLPDKVTGIGLMEFLRTVTPLPLMEWLASIVAPFPAEVQEQMKKQLQATDWQSWIAAFVVAGIIVEFGPEIIKSFGGVAKLAIGVLA